MENQVNLFVFDRREIRVVDKSGDPWFVAKDVCDVLGIENPTQAIENFPENERFALSNNEAKTLGFDHATAGVNVVNEPGLYRLIFQSRKPEAEAFKTWVFNEVLPSIRKTGGYRIPREEWRKVTDNINRHVDDFFSKGSYFSHSGSDYRHLRDWKEFMLAEVEEQKREKWEALRKLSVVKNAYNDLLQDDFATAKLLEQEEKRWKHPWRKTYLS